MKKNKTSLRVIALVAVLALTMGAVIGGTLAYLMDKTDPIVNTFTYGNIDIKLEETTGDTYENLVPGQEVSKDPTITVLGGSKNCWLYVQLDESENFDDFMTYAMNTDWTQLEGYDNIWYQSVNESEEDQTFQVLAGDIVTVRPEVTKEMVEALTDMPTLTVTAYAVQRDAEQDALSSALNAWLQVPQEVATVDDLKATLAKGEPAKLTADLTVPSKLVMDAPATVDLNGKTLTVNGSIETTSTLNIKNGNLDLAGEGVVANGSANVTLEGVNLNANNAWAALVLDHNENKLTMKDCHITAKEGNGYALMAWGSNNDVTLEGCTIEANVFGVYQNGSNAPSTYTIRNTKITATAGPGVFVSNSANRDKQTLIIEDSIIESAMTAVEVKHTDATIKNSTLTTTYAGGTFAKASGSGSCTKGYAFAVTANGASEKATGTVVVENCTLNGSTTGEQCGDYFVVERAEGASVTIDGTAVEAKNTYFTE